MCDFAPVFISFFFGARCQKGPVPSCIPRLCVGLCESIGPLTIPPVNPLWWTRAGCLMLCVAHRWKHVALIPCFTPTTFLSWKWTTTSPPAQSDWELPSAKWTPWLSVAHYRRGGSRRGASVSLYWVCYVQWASEYYRFLLQVFCCPFWLSPAIMFSPVWQVVNSKLFLDLLVYILFGQWLHEWKKSI